MLIVLKTRYIFESIKKQCLIYWKTKRSNVLKIVHFVVFIDPFIMNLHSWCNWGMTVLPNVPWLNNFHYIIWLLTFIYNIFAVYVHSSLFHLGNVQYWTSHHSIHHVTFYFYEIIMWFFSALVLLSSLSYTFLNLCWKVLISKKMYSLFCERKQFSNTHEHNGKLSQNIQ